MSTSQSILRIKRNKRIIGFAVSYRIMLDDVEIGKIRNGEEVSFHIPPGTHSVHIATWDAKSSKVFIEIQFGQMLELECGITAKGLFIQKLPEVEVIRARPQSDVNANSKPTETIQEQNFENTIETYAEEEFPIDNRFGGESLSVEHEVSKTASNDLTINLQKEKNLGLGVDVSFVKAQIAANISKQVGHTIGESVTRKQRFTFTVKPGEMTIYKIIWKRKVRSGEYLVSINHSWIPIAYRVEYDLVYEIKTVTPQT